MPKKPSEHEDCDREDLPEDLDSFVQGLEFIDEVRAEIDESKGRSKSKKPTKTVKPPALNSDETNGEPD
jgi:hypothetical protein